MTAVHLVENTTRLSEAIDHAISGDRVIILRDGMPIAEITPLIAEAKTKKPVDLEWLRARRIRVAPGGKSASETLEMLRNEY